jgi:FAD/FMN-containing dehydrogenase
MGTRTIDAAAVQSLRSNFRGELITAADAGYDRHRRVFNAMIDKHPALIARCTGVADVIGVVNFARRNELLVAVRGGAHSYSGNATCDGGLVIDLSPMKGIRVDPTMRTARAEGGVKLGELDRETQAFGLATTLGTVGDTGIAGLTLGGGLGWLMSKYGLACDNLIAADIVTADGRFLTASETTNADLLWGLRGGSGNFGVVTAFEYRLHPVDTVLGGMVLHPFARAKDVLHFFREFARTIPDELTLMFGVLMSPDGSPVVAIGGCYCGDLAEGEKTVAPLRTFGPPMQDAFGPVPYAVVQSLFDAAFPQDAYDYGKSDYLTGLSDEVIDLIVDGASRISSPHSVVVLIHFHGAVTRVRPDATAFPHRKDQQYSIHVYGQTLDSKQAPVQKQWARDLWQTVQPFTSGAVYVNELDVDEGEDRVRVAYGLNYDRLLALKNKYDPTNLFRVNANVRPTWHAASGMVV